MAYPDTFVRVSEEWVCKVLPYFGIGTKEYLKAGHAALVLIENETGHAAYYDFGRYITPKGKGRVRSAVTDAELEIPFKARIDDLGQLLNLKDLLLWLEANPKKTHGDGRLVASVCDEVDHEAAKNYILSLQGRGSIPYGAFVKEGSNCSRFVTDTILASTNNKKIISALKKNKQFTPSTVGNVEKAASEVVYQVHDGDIRTYNSSALKENLTNYFHKKPKTVVPAAGQTAGKVPKNAHYLEGIGSGAFFTLHDEHTSLGAYRIKRYAEDGVKDFEGVFKVSDFSFDSSLPFQFVYDSNCNYCHVEQLKKIFRFDLVKEQQVINSVREAHSA